MAYTVKEAIDLMYKEYDAYRLVCPDDILKIYKYNIIEHGGGSYDTTLTTQIFCEGDIRYLAFYGACNMMRVNVDPSFTLEQMKTLFRTFVPVSAEFLGYCGLNRIWFWAQQILEILDDLKDKDEFQELMAPFILLCCLYNTWVHHYMPWNAADNCKQVKPEDIEEIIRLAK
ncbi:MAG TPA: hypothetical protein GX520_08885 [Syntrophaceticus sp.]|jgi:hypothetical protein|nr:hypothetical protein [Syntrophaceticus sp.]